MSKTVPTIFLDAVASTNTEAFARAAAGEAGPLWIVARRQTGGKGRAGRGWSSEPGNLYASLLQRFRCPPAVISQLALLAGIATHDAIVAVAGPHALPALRLKWPNDVLIGDAKCAGILSESQLGQDEVTVVIGTGINLQSHPEDLGRPATDLARAGLAVTPQTMHAALAEATARWIAVWDEGRNFEALRRAWLERAGPAGEPISVNLGSERITGAFRGLDASGALLMRDDAGRERVVTFGDVSLGLSAGTRGRI